MLSKIMTIQSTKPKRGILQKKQSRSSNKRHGKTRRECRTNCSRLRNLAQSVYCALNPIQKSILKQNRKSEHKLGWITLRNKSILLVIIVSWLK